MAHVVAVRTVGIPVTDQGRALDFYVGVLGFEVSARMPDALFVSAGGYHHHLGFNTWQSAGGSPPAEGSTGLYHVAIRYPTRAALGDALRRLRDAGWPVDHLTDHGTHEAAYLYDPDENGLELAWDRPQDDWPRDDDGKLTFANLPRPNMDELIAAAG